jgi:hypothetical protein
MTRPVVCRRCAYTQRTHPEDERFTQAERIALRRTGLVGEREGTPIINAAVLPGVGAVFYCPWSTLSSPPVLMHGPAGVDDYSFIHRLSHCEVYPGGYFLKLFFIE